MKSFFQKKCLIVLFLGFGLCIRQGRQPNFVFAQETVAKAESPAEEQLDFAIGLFEKGLYEMAISEYQEFLANFPSNPNAGEAIFGIAESYFFMQDYPQAFEMYRQYKEKYPDGERETLCTLRQGQSLYLEGKPQEALMHLSSVKVEGLKGPFVQSLYFYLARSYQAQQDEDKAMDYFQKATAVPEATRYTAVSFLELGDLYSEKKEYAKAVEQYVKAQQNAPTPDLKGLALYKQGEAQFLAGQYELSTEIFKQILTDFPDEPIAQDALTNLLLGLFNSSHYEDIISTYLAYSDLVKKENLFVDGYLTVANAHAELKRYDDALKFLEKILSTKGLNEADKQKALLRKTQILVAANRPSDAVAFLESQLGGSDINPDKTMFTKAEALYAAAQYPEAFSLYQKLREEFPASSLAEPSLYGMAYAKYSAGESKAALDYFADYFQKGSDEEKRRQALYNAFTIAKKEDLNEKAIELGELYLKTFAESPQKDEILFSLGKLYPKLQQYDHAVTVFKEYMDRNKDPKAQQQANFLIAYNLQSSDRLDEAIPYYEKITAPADVADIPQKELYYSALKNMALIHLKKGEEQPAVQLFDRLANEFERNDLDINTYLWLAQYYLNQKQYQDVLRIVEKAKIHSGSNEVAAQIAFFSAEADRGLNDNDKAIAQYDVVFSGANKGVPDHMLGQARLGKGLSLVSLQQWEKARAVFNELIEKHPGEHVLLMRARFEIGALEQARHNLDEAAKFYMLVAVLYANDEYSPQALYRAGEIFEAQHKEEEALKVYEEIIHKYAQSPLAEKAKERIKVISEKS